jgi:benzodiazapine receptor
MTKSPTLPAPAGLLRWLGLSFWLILSFLPAWSGARFPPGDWYVQLRQPPLTPPGWLFAPVWTVLYALMGLAAWLVWQRAGWLAAARPLALFLLQLLLNGLWSYLFFGRQQPGLALLDLLALWLVVLFTLRGFWVSYQTAGLLLVPYLLWLSFAAYLNLGFWLLNR